LQQEKHKIVMAILAGSVFILVFGVITFLVVINYIRRKRKILLDIKVRELQFQQELLQAQLKLQDHTLRVVSQ